MVFKIWRRRQSDYRRHPNVYRSSNGCTHQCGVTAYRRHCNECSVCSPAAVIVRALYDYQLRQQDDLSFNKGDRMELVGDR